MAWPAFLSDTSLLRRRGAAFVLALAIELLVALLLWFLAPALPGRKEAPRTVVFGVEAPSDSDAAAAADKASDAKASAAARPRAAQRPAPPPPHPDQPPPTPVPAGPMPFLKLSRDEMAQGDIARAPVHAASGDADAAESPAGGPRPGDSARSGGKGPHGEPLYNAEWYVRPTHAQLETYRSRRAIGSGWGLIACRTVARHRVEDCVILDEGPRGSGYGESVRQAAWQFQVRAPRVGGREMVGEWVSIRIDYELTRD